MSLHAVRLVLDVDDEMLDAHLASGKGGTVPPYSRDLAEWDASDVVAASEEGIIDMAECTYSYDFEVKS